LCWDLSGLCDAAGYRVSRASESSSVSGERVGNELGWSVGALGGA
jgi:hypothetical protein